MNGQCTWSSDVLKIVRRAFSSAASCSHGNLELQNCVGLIARYPSAPRRWLSIALLRTHISAPPWSTASLQCRLPLNKDWHVYMRTFVITTRGGDCTAIKHGLYLNFTRRRVGCHMLLDKHNFYLLIYEPHIPHSSSCGSQSDLSQMSLLATQPSGVVQFERWRCLQIL